MHIDLQPEFGDKLFALRSSRIMTQEELAEAAGISVDMLGALEQGKKATSFRTLKRLANALGVPVKDLFDFDSPPNWKRGATVKGK